MAVMGRSHPQERILSQTFNKWWKFSRQKNSALRTVDFELKKLPFDRDPLPQELLDHSYFWLSDHSRQVKANFLKLRLTIYFNVITF